MILLIDNYDSFTYNLYQYLGELHKEIQVVRHDEISIQQIKSLSPQCIVLSPGPKTPTEAGICMEVVQQLSGMIPILGICLGHQCIAASFGATVTYAKKLYHGKTSMVTHTGTGIFKNLPNPMEVARYHSLAVLPHTLPEELIVTAQTEDGEVMAITHKTYPLVGLQFHPESIYTPEGKQLIKNFLEGVNAYVIQTNG